MIKELHKIPNIQAIIPTAAIKGKNLDMVFDEILKVLPIGERHLMRIIIQTSQLDFWQQKLLGESFQVLDKEIPYGIAVVVNAFKEKTI